MSYSSTPNNEAQRIFGEKIKMAARKVGCWYIIRYEIPEKTHE